MSVGTQGLAEMRGEVEMQPAFPPNNDARIAYDIRKAVDDLNKLLRLAAEAGITTRFSDRAIMRLNGTDQQQIEIALSKVL